jgi:hypothetical protein
MAYEVSNPPFLIAQGVGNSRKVWMYVDGDAITDVRVSGYFTNGYSLGMRAKDIIIVVDDDASPISAQICVVNASSKSGSTETVDISDGTAITATDSD